MKHLRKYNESVSREKLNFRDISKDELVYCALYGDGVIKHNDEVYKFVKKEQKSFDSEKGYVTYEIIIQRESDGKYFKGSGENWGRGEVDVDTEFEEVSDKTE